MEDSRHTPTLANRIVVLLIGVFGGALLMGIASLTQLPKDVGFEYRFQCWAIMMGGPIVGAATGFAASHSFLCIGWLGPPMIVANTMKPNALTAFLAIGGFVVWFASGFFTVIGMVWGA